MGSYAAARMRSDSSGSVTARAAWSEPTSSEKSPIARCRVRSASPSSRWRAIAWIIAAAPSV